MSGYWCGLLVFHHVVLMLDFFLDQFGSGGSDGVRGFFGKHRASIHSSGTGPLHFVSADHAFTSREDMTYRAFAWAPGLASRCRETLGYYTVK